VSWVLDTFLLNACLLVVLHVSRAPFPDATAARA